HSAPPPLRGFARRPNPYAVEPDEPLGPTAASRGTPRGRRTDALVSRPRLRRRTARRSIALFQPHSAALAGGRWARVSFAGEPPPRSAPAARCMGRCREALLVGRARLGRDRARAVDRPGQQSHVPELDVRGRSLGTPARRARVPRAPWQWLLHAVALL